MIQYSNGSRIKPSPDDLIVFQDNEYGHVAVITKVEKDFIEIIQQNVPGKVRQKLNLIVKKGKYFILSPRKPVGWLRLPGKSQPKS